METEEAWLEWVRKKLVEAANNDNSVDYETFILALKIKDVSLYIDVKFDDLLVSCGAYSSLGKSQCCCIQSTCVTSILLCKTQAPFS